MGKIIPAFYDPAHPRTVKCARCGCFVFDFGSYFDVDECVYICKFCISDAEKKEV